MNLNWNGNYKQFAILGVYLHLSVAGYKIGYLNLDIQESK
jgi:hypothetical protein